MPGRAFSLRRDETEFVFVAERLQRRPQFGIRRHTAGNNKRRCPHIGIEHAEPFEPTANAVLQGARHRALEGGADIGDVLFRHRLDRLRRLTHRGLKAGEGKIEPRLADERARKGEAFRIAGLRHALDRRPARIGQAEQLGRLVEGFPQRVVDRRAPALVIVDATHQHELGMAAGDEQHEIGKGEPVGQPRRQRMAFQMVDGIERLAHRPSDRLARHQPDDEPTDQPRPACRSDRIDILQRAPGTQKRFGNQAVQRLHMGARRDLRHHAAIGAVLLELAQHDFTENLALSVRIAHDDGSGGLVAARFDAENGQLGRHEALGLIAGGSKAGYETSR